MRSILILGLALLAPLPASAGESFTAQMEIPDGARTVTITLTPNAKPGRLGLTYRVASGHDRTTQRRDFDAGVAKTLADVWGSPEFEIKALTDDEDCLQRTTWRLTRGSERRTICTNAAVLDKLNRLQQKLQALLAQR